MSAIGGILATGSQPPHRPLAALAAGLARRGPDGCATVRLGRAAMVHRPFHTTARSRQEPQPRLTGDGLLLAWDGRLDADLAPSADATELVLAAYRRHGDELADALPGDFALALWDEREQTLVLARDPFSDRSLFYGEDRRGRFLWASNVASLLAAGDFATDLDETWISGYLATVRPQGRTPFLSLSALPPGHVLTLRRGRRHLRRYWPGDSLGEVRCAGDGEYEERFHHLLSQAVRHHLDASAPVFVELSGGVDSSSIACLAEHLLERGEASAPQMRTCSYVYREAPRSDETAPLQRVEAQLGRGGFHVDEHRAPILAGFEEPWAEIPSDLGMFRARFEAVAAEMACHGSRVVLNGLGGDEAGISEIREPPHLADLAARGRLPTLLRELVRWRPECRASYPGLLWRGAVLPLLPAALQTRLTPNRRLADWVSPGFARRSGYRHHWRSILPGPAEAGLPRPSMKHRCAGLRATVLQVIDALYLHADLVGRENRFPFLHRPFVEFCLGLPLDQLVRPGETRSLHRRALAGVLPPEIAQRRDKGGPDDAMMRALAREWPRLRKAFSGDAHIYDAGFVERQPFLTALGRARSGLLHLCGPVFRAIELETWLRTLAARPTPAATAGQTVTGAAQQVTVQSAEAPQDRAANH